MEIAIKHIMLLVELIKKGGRYSYINITTTELGEILNKSQQTISNNLLELERNNYIERVKDGKGFKIKVTEKCNDELFKLFLVLKHALEDIKEIEIKGIITKGMGEGSYYISLPGYKKQFIQKLGFEPYRGTLNIKLEPYYRGVKSVLKMQPGIFIEGFNDGNRTYGWVKCYRASIDSIEGAVLILERTHHDDSILEIIAPVKIMEKMNVDYGSTITVKIRF
ncbi:MAG: DUF120 domain-containing protein [Candidatus Nitrosocaldaceae archaeon]